MFEQSGSCLQKNSSKGKLSSQAASHNHLPTLNPQQTLASTLPREQGPSPRQQQQERQKKQEGALLQGQP